MQKLLISSEAHAKMVQVANSSVQGYAEVSHLFACLQEIELKASEFWNVGDSASGNLTSCATLKNGAPIWRLCPTQVHCIGLLVEEQDGVLWVLAVCSRAEIEKKEAELMKCCR
jgi:hypothetical protein